MHNAYITSTIYALRGKGSLSFCFNDYCNSPYSLSDRFERNPVRASFSQCCSCCGDGFSSLRSTVARSCSYGPRQSSLLQWSASRKVVFNGGNRLYCYCDCSTIYAVERACCDVSCCVGERISCSNGRRRSKGRFYAVGGDDSSRVDDTEALLSLLSERVEGEEDSRVYGGKTRNTRRRDFRDRNSRSDLYERLEERKRGNDDGFCECGRKKSGEIKFRGVDRIKSRSENVDGVRLRRENHTLRKDGSSCSSYYSAPSTEGSDDEIKVHDKHTLLGEEIMSGYKDGELEEEGRFSVTRNQNNVTEKKHGDRLFEEEIHESGQKSSERHTRLQGNHRSSHEQISTSHLQFKDKENSSALTDYVDRQARKQYAQINNQVGEASTSKKTSSSRLRLGNYTEENVEISKDEWREAVSYKAEDENINRKSQIRRSSDFQEFDDQRTSISQTRSEIGVEKYRENVSKERQELQHVTYQEDEARGNSEQRIRISEVHETNTEENSITNSQTSVSNQVNNTNLINVLYQPQTDRRPPQRAQSEKRSHIVTDTEVNRLSETQRVVDSRRTSRHQGGEVISVGTSASAVGVGNSRTNEKLGKSRSRKDLEDSSISQELHRETRQQARRNSEQPVTISEIHDTHMEGISLTNSQTSVSNQVNNTNLISVSYQPQTGQRPPLRAQSGQGSYIVSDTDVTRVRETERVDSRRTSEAKVQEGSEAMLVGTSVSEVRVGNDQTNEKLGKSRSRKELEETSLSSQPHSVAQSSLRHEFQTGFVSQKISNKTESFPSSSYRESETQNDPMLPYDSHKRRGALHLAAPEDAMASAVRLQQSSADFVAEFVETARHEALASQTQELGEVSGAEMAYRDDSNMQKTLSQPGKEGLLSSGSGSKGEMDEMWDVNDPSLSKTPRAEQPEASATAENAIAKRSGKSLWNIFSDIVTLKWGSHSENPSAASQSGRRISSNESAVSEAWFSTHESEQSRDKPASEAGLLKPEIKTKQLQGNESGRFTDGTQDSEIYRSPSTASEKIFLSREGSKSLRASPSGTEIITNSPSPLVISQISDAKSPKSDFVGQIELNVPSKANEASASEGSGGAELKRRKLQRIKQVPKDRFDEWEEAFTLESEQRRLDEKFMKEALVEAKKAADTWEVPVGAVLVHNGDIIARGYNLVEELRDSTAHAEMICIREASNQLRSWRLADTTLYVTLEPCPMCAGAILQARVSSVVWGAPNKLLGADGSWIRLFPDNGGDSSNSSEKPAAPIHPFHPKINIRRGVLGAECAEVMQQFFQLRRKKKEKLAVAEVGPSSRFPGSNPAKLLKKMHDVFHVMFCL